MEHITFLEKRIGNSLRNKETSLYPVNNKDCVCRSAFLSIERILKIAYKMDEKPNIIIREGSGCKWHLIRSPKDLIDSSIEKQRRWIDISRSTIWIVNWDL